jgi:PhnB protein
MFKFCRTVFGTDCVTPINCFGDMLPPPSHADKQLVMPVALPILGGHALMGADAHFWRIQCSR